MQLKFVWIFIFLPLVKLGAHFRLAAAGRKRAVERTIMRFSANVLQASRRQCVFGALRAVSAIF